MKNPECIKKRKQPQMFGKGFGIFAAPVPSLGNFLPNSSGMTNGGAVACPAFLRLLRCIVLPV